MQMMFHCPRGQINQNFQFFPNCFQTPNRWLQQHFRQRASVGWMVKILKIVLAFYTLKMKHWRDTGRWKITWLVISPRTWQFWWQVHLLHTSGHSWELNSFYSFWWSNVNLKAYLIDWESLTRLVDDTIESKMLVMFSEGHKETFRHWNHP